MRMMRSPFRKTGTIKVEVATDKGLDEVMKRVEQALHRATAEQVRVNSNAITFRGGPLRAVSNWNVLRPISSGEIHFDQSGNTVTICYRVSWLGLFIVFTGIFGALLSLNDDPKLFFILPAAWVAFLVLTYLEIAIRFHEFLARAANPQMTVARLGDPFPDY